MRLRVDSEFLPRRLRKIDVVVFCGFLDIGESQCTIGVRHAGNLVEPGHGVAYVTRVR